jgi:serine/threonine protein kinase
MKRICMRCQRMSPDGNLWCPETDCPAGAAPLVMDFGDCFGDLEIVKPVRVLRTTTLYQARRGNDALLLKVAHENHETYIRDEADFMATLKSPKLVPDSPFLELVSPYPSPSTKQQNVGKYVFRGEMRTFALYKYVEGDFLRDLLLRNPEPWVMHVGWFMIRLSNAVSTLHKQNRLHLNLSPDVILVRYSATGVPMPVLLDIGIGTAPNTLVTDSMTQEWASILQPAYAPPEVLFDDKENYHVGLVSDIYELGLVMYEMLAGNPVFNPKLHKEEDTAKNVKIGAPSFDRNEDLPHGTRDLVRHSVARAPLARKPAKVEEFQQSLIDLFHTEPIVVSKWKFWRNRWLMTRVIIISIIALLFITIFIIVYILRTTLG